MAAPQSSTPRRVVPLDERVTLATGRAMAQGFRIEPCDRCGGPKVCSKVQPLARCLRCGERFELQAIAQHKDSWRRCALCHKPNMAGIPRARRYCRECARLSGSERSKRLRWNAERAAVAADKSAPDSTNKIKGVSSPATPNRPGHRSGGSEDS